ncbi:hypothetical protein SDC9_146395 [bioreactor metagenome]|uniref:Uncharacterized protein n=1 Tax=bioreactor metagenome TaxID=1076179 RepID=A0A645EAW2_9ZZZZ
MARSNENASKVAAEAHNFLNFFSKIKHIIAIPLLPETAETIKVLPYLGSSEPHGLTELFGRNFGDACAD